MIRIAVLITCHNRKQKTISCLHKLFQQEGIGLHYLLKVYLVDDGSTDNTAEAVRTLFPMVEMIPGDGELYWNRGMYVAWETASAHPCEYFLWLNDDTELYHHAINELLACADATENNAVICGCIESPTERGVITYGGKRINDKPLKLIYPTGNMEHCEVINGNCILVPQNVFKKTGNLDWRFRHAIGDYDYGLRAIKAGFGVFTTRTFIAACAKNKTLPKWCLKETGFIQRVKNLYSPLGHNEPGLFFIYEKRHFGLLTAIKHFLSIHLRLLFPSLWNSKQD